MCIYGLFVGRRAVCPSAITQDRASTCMAPHDASCGPAPPVAVVVPCADVYGSSFELKNAETVRQEAFNVSNSGSRCEN